MKTVYCTFVEKHHAYAELSRIYVFNLPEGIEVNTNDILLVENLFSASLVQCICVLDVETQTEKNVIKNLGAIKEYSAFEEQILEASRLISSGEKTIEDFIGSYMDEIAWSNFNESPFRKRRHRSVR